MAIPSFLVQMIHSPILPYKLVLYMAARRATRKHHAAEEKIRIVLDGLRGEYGIAELCRREGIAQGIIWVDELISHKDRTIQDIADRHNLSDRNVRSRLSLGLLAPEIVEAAIDGRLARGVTVTQMADLPSDWAEQKRALGIA